MDSQLTLITKATGLSPPVSIHLYQPTQADIVGALSKLDDSRYVGVDIETTGLDPTRSSISSIAVSDADLAVAVDVRDPAHLRYMVEWLDTKSWFAYNTVFDGGFLIHAGANPDAIVGDAFIMYRLLATEGYTGQSWSLDSAISGVLGWNVNSKDEWTEVLKKHKLSKADMYKALDLEPEAFLRYNAMDAAAAYQLMMELRGQARELGFANLLEWHDEYLTLIKLTIEQQLRGTSIDLEGAIAYEEELRSAIQTAEINFKSHPSVKEYIDRRNREAEGEAAASAITYTTKRVWGRKADIPWEKPYEWTPIEASAYPNATAWEKQKGFRYYKDLVSVKYKTAKPAKVFNIASADHRRDLFYHSGIFRWHWIRPHAPEASNVWDRIGQIGIPTPCGHVAEVEATDGGEPPTDADSLAFFGDAGKLYGEWADLVKRKQFVDALLELQLDGVWHPMGRVFATVTGRGAG